MKFNRTTIIMLSSLLFMGLAVAFNVFADVRLETERSQLQNQLQVIADERALVSERATITTLVAETATDRAELETYILEGDDGTVQLLSELDQLASARNIELTTTLLEVSAVDPKVASEFKNLSVGLSLSGRDVDIEQFILLLETIPYQSELVSLQMSSTRSVTTGVNNVTADVSIIFSITNV